MPAPTGDAEPRRTAPAAPAPTSASGVRVEDGEVLWSCPACGSENALDVRACARCGTPFGKLFEVHEPPPRVTAERAAALSLLFPGVGHIAARRVADGLARSVVFAFTLGMAVAILAGAGGLGGPLVPLLILFLGASACLYLATSVDAHRAVTGDPPVLTTRILLIGATVLMVLATGVLILGGARAGP